MLPRSTSAVALRFIPAGAGNTPHDCCANSSETVHPRRRGEHLSYGVACEPPYGSSPQARGTRAQQDRQSAQRRFIPAGAGNTSACRRYAAEPSVHPRRRGEHLRRCRRRIQQPRFIPAGAGNTVSEISLLGQNPVHPRRRGEHCRCNFCCFCAYGSSPQARGTLLLTLKSLL